MSPEPLQRTEKPDFANSPPPPDPTPVQVHESPSMGFSGGSLRNRGPNLLPKDVLAQLRNSRRIGDRPQERQLFPAILRHVNAATFGIFRKIERIGEAGQPGDPGNR